MLFMFRYQGRLKHEVEYCEIKTLKAKETIEKRSTKTVLPAAILVAQRRRWGARHDALYYLNRIHLLLKSS